MDILGIFKRSAICEILLDWLKPLKNKSNIETKSKVLLKVKYKIILFLTVSLIRVFIESATTREFLAFQGDVWDTHKDLALEMAGALIGLFTSRNKQNK